MNWPQLLSPVRLGEEDKAPSDQSPRLRRMTFDKDHDRLVFCRAFRRLGRKTQVHPLAKNDHVHNRLTHSLEVASIGRTLGLTIAEWLNDTQGEDVSLSGIAVIVQSACLAHDIGNPPFGHAGEFAIRSWFEKNANRLQSRAAPLTDAQFADLKLYEGNAQAFRLLTAVEGYARDGEAGGLRLCYPTLATLVKYPWTSQDERARQKAKFNCFCSEAETFDKIFTHLGLKQGGQYLRHPLALLMEAADDIAYGIIDLEDAVEMGAVEAERVLQLLRPLAGHGIRKESMPRLRGISISILIERCVEVFKAHYESIMAGTFEGGLADAIEDQATQQALRDIKHFSRHSVYTERRKVELEVGAYNILGQLLAHGTEAVDDVLAGRDNFYADRLLKLFELDKAAVPEDGRYLSYMKLMDFISGMTDDYAVFIANQIAGKAG